MVLGLVSYTVMTDCQPGRLYNEITANLVDGVVACSGVACVTMFGFIMKSCFSVWARYKHEGWHFTVLYNTRGLRVESEEGKPSTC